MKCKSFPLFVLSLSNGVSWQHNSQTARNHSCCSDGFELCLGMCGIPSMPFKSNAFQQEVLCFHHICAFSSPRKTYGRPEEYLLQEIQHSLMEVCEAVTKYKNPSLSLSLWQSVLVFSSLYLLKKKKKLKVCMVILMKYSGFEIL